MNKRTKEHQKKLLELPNDKFRELFVINLKKEIEKEQNKKFPPFAKAKREVWILKMKQILRDVEVGTVNDKELKTTKKQFERLKNEFLLNLYLWLIILIIISGMLFFVLMVTLFFLNR